MRLDGLEGPARPRRAGSRRGMRSTALKTVAGAIRAGAGSYDRARDLPGLIRIDSSASLPDGASAARLIVVRLQAALRAERARARSGHWTYDLNRHIALHQAYQAELGRLTEIKTGGSRHPAGAFRV